MGEPVFTSVFSDNAQFEPAAGSLYIAGESVEDRSRHSEVWERKGRGVTFASVQEASRSEVRFSVGERVVDLRLRSVRNVETFLKRGSYSAIYLDVTGLEHHVWAPLLRGMASVGKRAFCVYVEPGDYRFSSAPTEVRIFDLSERIEGIGPLPGFLSLREVDNDEALFVPLLGFEGARLTFMTEHVLPKREQVWPVVGVPGFRPEYPFYSFLGNGLPLRENGAWQSVRFASANCPFSLYFVLGRLSEENPGRFMRVAPIGTKPHAVGAVLYYLTHEATTEILYDHPVRDVGRTVGAARTCVYDVSAFLEGLGSECEGGGGGDV